MWPAAADAGYPRPVASAEPAQRFLLLLVDDLMAGSRIEATARHLGYAARYARSAEAFWAALDEGPALVLVGTHHTRLPWESLLEQLQRRPAPPPVLAFGAHVDTETRRRARALGVTRWAANARMAADLPTLIRETARE